jgi:hypothetical protein
VVFESWHKPSMLLRCVRSMIKNALQISNVDGFVFSDSKESSVDIGFVGTVL